MKIKIEKYLIYSMVILILGWLYFFIINYLNYSDFGEQFNEGGLLISFPRPGKFDTIWFKLIAIVFGIISLYFGYKSKPHIQRKLRVLLISLSLLLIIISIVAFPNLIMLFANYKLQLFGESSELLSFIKTRN